MYGGAAPSIMKKPAHIVMAYLEEVNRQLGIRHYEDVMANLVPHYKPEDMNQYLNEIADNMMTEEQREDKRKADIKRLKQVMKKINKQ